MTIEPTTTEIITTGTAERSLPADRATLHLRVSVTDANREDAVRRAAELHEALVRRAEALVSAGDAERFEADPLTTSSSSWEENGARRTEHYASAGVRVLLLRLDQVGALTAELSTAGVDPSVEWRLSDELRGEVESELRGEAVVDARVRAEDYAAAIGTALGAVLEVREPGSAGGSGGSDPLRRALRASGLAGGLGDRGTLAGIGERHARVPLRRGLSSAGRRTDRGRPDPRPVPARAGVGRWICSGLGNVLSK